MDLGTIKVVTDIEALSEVVVRGALPLIQQKIDRTVVNVQNTVLSAGNTALNVLSRTPLVTINRSTNQIGLMGKQGVLVMINDKEVRMDQADLVAYLDALPAANIETIELITAPPARYDAQGGAGIINIKTRNIDTDGLSGRYGTNAGIGKRPKFGGNLSISWKKNRWYMYGNLSTNQNFTLEPARYFTEKSFSGDQVNSELIADRRPYVGLYNGEFGLDYDLGEKTILGTNISMMNSIWDLASYSETNSESSLRGTLIDITEANEENRLLRVVSNISLRHSFSSDTQISFDYDNIQFNRKNPSDYKVLREGQDFIERSNFISSAETPLDINVGKVDLTSRLNEAIQLETGVKLAFSSFTNNVRVANEINDEFVEDPAFTDSFEMDEEIYAAYISGDWQINEDLMLKSGLRYEYYYLNLISQNDGQLTDRRRGRFFPSAYLSYRINDNSEWNLSYVKRIQRPGFTTLAPWFYFFDQNTLFTGNPTVIPTLTNQFQTDFRYKTFNLRFQYTHDDLPVFNWIPEVDDAAQLFIVRPVQGESMETLSLTANAPLRINNWWTTDNSLILYYFKQRPIIGGEVFQQNSGAFNFSTTHSFTISDNQEMEISFNYNSPYRDGIIQVGARYGLDLEFSKKWDSGTALTFSVTDIFNTMTRWPLEMDIRDRGIFYEWEYDTEAPVFRLNLSVPFGNRNLKKRAKNRSGSEEEQRRLN
ncbi:MAG: TonB-dependent receptor [Bacteroidota bacterium]